MTTSVHATPLNTTLAILLASTSMVSACTWQQAYTTGQAWQRNQCNRLIESTERDRCLANASMAYDDYRRQAEPKAKE